jgi:hypothetical protein
VAVGGRWLGWGRAQDGEATVAEEARGGFGRVRAGELLLFDACEEAEAKRGRRKWRRR